MKPIETLREFRPKSRLLKIFTKVDNFQNLNQNRNFSKIPTNPKILKNFDQNLVFKKFWISSKFLKIRQKPGFFLSFDEIFDKNRDFRKFWSKLLFWVFPKILTKIESFGNVDWNEYFW